MENMSSEFLMELIEIRKSLQAIASNLEQKHDVSMQGYDSTDFGKQLEYYRSSRSNSENKE